MRGALSPLRGPLGRSERAGPGRGPHRHRPGRRLPSDAVENLTAHDIRQARDSLQAILAGIARGELAAAPLLAHGIQGAVATLGALLEEDSSPLHVLSASSP